MAQASSAADSNGLSKSSSRTATRKLTFLDLPHETQKEILSHCSQSELICLSLVSRHFRELAAAPLYRNFHIVFPDEDDPSFDSPIDGLAGGLDTFVTSDYDYGKHLRDLSLDTLSAGDKAAVAYKPYLYHVSCGKFMNTLLLLTLRKARSLESFRWNIRVELSRPVYRALHQIGTLNNLHIRLQAGPSLYETPPPLPYSHSSSSSITPAPAHVTYLPSELQLLPPGGPPPPPPPPTFGISAPQSIFYTPPATIPPPPAPKHIVRTKVTKKLLSGKEPPTLSGFRNLKKLAVLDIDSLDMVPEIKACVKNSAATLTKLKLSFSDALGSQSRKPAPEADPDDSDPEDEFQPPPLPPSAGFPDDVSGPVKVFRAQEERKTQETVLGRIFDVEPAAAKKPVRKPREKEKDVVEEPEATDPGRAFINAIRAVSNKLMKHVNGAGDFSLVQQEVLDTIEAAARKYVASEDAKDNSVAKSSDKTADASSSTRPTIKVEDADSTGEAKDEEEEEEEPSKPTSSSSRTGKAKDSSDGLKPEDISIEEPEEQLNVELVDVAPKETTVETPPSETEAAASERSTPSAPQLAAAAAAAAAQAPSMPLEVREARASMSAQLASVKALMERMENYEKRVAELNKEVQELRALDGAQLDESRLADAERQMHTMKRYIDDINEKVEVMEALVDSVRKDMPATAAGGGGSGSVAEDDAQAQSRRASEYVRSTRGLALESLSIYLIPVKASVLSRAVDLRVLQRLTLLNVGPQAPIWALLARENKAAPLPLRKIFTDNVSAVFLNFVAQLEELHELFMLERDSKYKPESFAPRSVTTIDQIRKLVLRRHLPKLRRLMIKNQADSNWDIDDKTILLICRLGADLRELAVNMGIKTMHTFLQNIAGLVNLRALHIIQLKNEDTCVWVMRETKRFLVDNVSHHPELKLEWVSVDDEDRVDRIIRPSDLPKKDKDAQQGKDKATNKAKGKQKATTAASNSVSFGSTSSAEGVFPILPPLDSLDAAAARSDSDDDDDDDDDVQTGRLEPIEVHFYDTWGVRIFKKEIVAGRL